MTPDQKMSLDEMQSRLHDLGVDVAKETLKNWAYHRSRHIVDPTRNMWTPYYRSPIIDPPERYKHGKGSGKKGRAVNWSEKALCEAAAVWALKNSPRIKKTPPMRLIPFIKRSADMIFDSPIGIYRLPEGRVNLDEFTYKSIKPQLPFPYPPWYAIGGGAPPPQDEWTELVTTWIAANKKAKEGKKIKDPYEVCYYWKSKKYKVIEESAGMEFVIEEGVKYELEKITLKKKKPSSNYDEVVIMIDGVDFRRKMARMLRKSLKTVNESEASH